MNTSSQKEKEGEKKLEVPMEKETKRITSGELKEEAEIKKCTFKPKINSYKCFKSAYVSYN